MHELDIALYNNLMGYTAPLQCMC